MPASTAPGTHAYSSGMLGRFCSLLLLIAPTVAKGQLGGSDFLVRIWQSEEGLPGNVVRSLGQTPDGFLWVATAEGLARFDGIEFEKVTSTGAYRGRGLGFFRLFTPADGSVWLSTYGGGLLRVERNRLVQVVEDSGQSSPQLITRLVIVDDQTYFVRNQDIRRLEGPGGVAVDALPPNVAAALDRDRAEQRRRGRRDSAELPTRLVGRSGGVWTVQDRSLHYAEPGEGPQPASMPELQGRLLVNDMLEDREGNLWLATPVHGLVRIRHRRPLPMKTDEGAYLQPVHTALQARDGTWWIANRDGGVDRLAAGKVTHHELQPGYARPVCCIFQDRRDRLWFASRDGSVFEWTGSGFEPSFPGNQAVSKVNAIAEDARGRLWFGGGQGLSRWDGSEVTSFRDHPRIGDAEFSTLTFTGDGTLYAGTVDGRIYRHDGEDFSLLGHPGDLRGRWVSAIVALDPDELWVATVNAGLFLRRDGRWHRFGSEHSIPDEGLTAMIAVGEDTFWLGSLGGILRTSRSELLRSVTNPDLPPRWMRLDRSDGMVTRECVGGAQPGVTRDRDGMLWFPTTGGLAGLRPGRIRPQTAPPPVYLHPVEVDGVPVPAGDGPIVAGPGHVRLDFRFTGLSLTAPEKVTYRVRLLGFEDDFGFNGTDREYSYGGLSPGSYRFEVIATNGDGFSTLFPASVPIEIRPYFWQTPWFMLLTIVGSLLLALAVGWAIARHRMRGKLEALHIRSALQGERARISQDLHDDLGASLTELSILSALAVEDPDADKLRSSADQLSRKAKGVVGALDEIVWATNPREDSLRSLVDYLAAFAREFLDSVQVPLRTEVTREVPEVMIGPRRRHNVFLATREAINNAVKHANPSSIHLRIAIEDEHLVVRVTDDGKGFAVEYAESGNGLTNLRRRMTDCGGSCRIESVQGGGTTVTISLPVPRS